jgi:hypothetical protein
MDTVSKLKSLTSHFYQNYIILNIDRLYYKVFFYDEISNLHLTQEQDVIQYNLHQNGQF